MQAAQIWQNQCFKKVDLRKKAFKVKKGKIIALI